MAAPHLEPDVFSACDHCGLPLSPGQGSRFCCAGCESVHAAITGAGLGAYYSLRDRPGRPLTADPAGYEALDAPSVQARLPLTHNGAREAQFYIDGVHCAACVWLLEKLPTLMRGVRAARLSYAEARLVVTWDPEETKLSAIARKLESLGYPPHLAGLSGGGAEGGQKRTDRSLLIRIGVAGAAFGNVMLASVALYSGDAYGMDPGTQALFRWLTLAVTLPCVLYGAQPFFRGALASVRTRTAHMDLPISVGIAAALTSGTVSTLAHRGETYFDSVTMLVFLLLVGRYLQMRQQRSAAQASDVLSALAPSTARVLEGGRMRPVPTVDVEPGMLVEILPGESVGVDARVVEGDSTIDQSLMTGESRPERVVAGDSVLAGTVNLSRRLVVKVTSGGADTRLSHLVRQLHDAAQSKSPVVELANRLSGYFLVGVSVLSLVGFGLWFHEGWARALDVATTLLIVTCPCALGLATPLLTSIAVGQAAKRGLLVKGGKYLESLNQPSLLVFDKTGTLTQGKLTLVNSPTDKRLLSLIQAAEADSRHPVALALRAELVMPSLRAESSEETLGEGVRAQVGGRAIAVGRAGFVAKHLGPGVTASELLARETAADILSQGLSPVFVALDGQLAAVLGVGDAVRPEAAAALRALRAAGHRLAIVSGDHQAVVDSVAQALGGQFECAQGGYTPEGKLKFVREALAHGPVLMVGDGVNDAAALAAATVGIAVAGGAEASLAAADVFATRGGLAPLVELVQGARRALRTIHQNLGFSLAYNAVAAGLALGGVISPLAAAILMPLSSMTVLANSVRVRLFQRWDEGSPS